MEKYEVNKKKNGYLYILFYVLNLGVLLGFYIQHPIFSNYRMIVWSIIICSIFSLTQKKIRIDIRDILLVIALLSYAVLTDKNFSWGRDIVLLPVMLMFVGKYFTFSVKENDDKEKWIFYIIGVMILGYSTHGFLNSMIFLKNGFTGPGRSWFDIWANFNYAATQQVFYFYPVMALAFPAILYFKKNVILSLGVILANLFFLYVSVKSLSRAPLVVFGFIFCVELFIWCIWNRKRIAWKKVIKISFPVMLVSLILVIGIGTYVFVRMPEQFFVWIQTMGRDGGILRNIRFKVQIGAVRQLLLYPMGGYQMDMGDIGYAHNLWLDTANAAGLIPFFSLIIYTMIAFYDLYKFLKIMKISQIMRLSVLGIFLTFMIFYMTEPALEATVLNIVPWTFLCGVIYACNKIYSCSC